MQFSTYNFLKICVEHLEYNIPLINWMMGLEDLDSKSIFAQPNHDFLCSGVSTISFPTHDSCIYTAGKDGMICKLDSMTGNLLGKFTASTKAISSMSVSSGLQLYYFNIFIYWNLFTCCFNFVAEKALWVSSLLN